MNELFLKSSKIKLEIEKAIDSIYNSRDYYLNQDGRVDIEEEFKNKMQKLEANTKELTLKLNSYVDTINNMKSQLEVLKKTSTPDIILISQKKIQNSESSVIDLNAYLKKAYKHRGDILREEFQKNNLFGERNRETDQNNTKINILISEQEVIKRTNQNTQTMIESSRRIVTSLAAQGEKLRKQEGKIKKIVSHLDLSSYLSKLITRRSRMDTYIICLGFVFLIFFMGFLLFYVRPYVRSFF